MRDRFEHTLECKPADNADGAVTTVRRIELITGTGRRRDKARIVVESPEGRRQRVRGGAAARAQPAAVVRLAAAGA
jgi:hypothetical protein